VLTIASVGVGEPTPTLAMVSTGPAAKDLTERGCPDSSGLTGVWGYPP
jgi:hypothetical protein